MGYVPINWRFERRKTPVCLELAFLICLLIVILIFIIGSLKAETDKQIYFQEKQKSLALSKALYEQKERELAEVNKFNSALNREFKHNCEMNLALKLPITSTCKEILKK